MSGCQSQLKAFPRHGGRWFPRPAGERARVRRIKKDERISNSFMRVPLVPGLCPGTPCQGGSACLLLCSLCSQAEPGNKKRIKRAWLLSSSLSVSLA
jgi:hypothetical protein